MLSVGIVTGSGIGYYVDTVGSGVDDYYVRTEPGRWYGAGARAADLDGIVAAGAVEALTTGTHPASGLPLGGPGGKVAAYDLTFSAPKSVSVLAELTADAELRAAVLDAHHRAIAATVGLLEAEAVRGRRGHAGAIVVPTVGIIGAGFDHHTSRAGDPQLHTHLLVANRALGTDGRWGALDGRRLYAWAKTAGYAYQAALRAELTTTLGVTWGPVLNGAADLADLDRRVLARFSSRRAQIIAALAEAGATSPRAAQVAALATRPAKPDPLHPDAQRAVWVAQASLAGLDTDTLGDLTGPGRWPAPLDPGRLAAVLGAPTGLTARRSSFDRRHVLEAVAASTADGATVIDVVAAARHIARDERFVLTGAAGHLAGPTWTTTELVATEAALLGGVDRRRHASVAVGSPGAISPAIDSRPGLSDEQTAMVRRLLGDGHGVEIVVGPAGTGKTYALDAARAAWANSGIDVIGAALAARTARALEAGTGIPSATVDQLLADLGRPGRAGQRVLPFGGVLIVDEAGMVGTRKLAQLLAFAEGSQTKVVLVGDPRQLPEIDAGGAFAALAKRRPPIELTVNRRQEHAWERHALAHLRQGNPSEAVVAYRDHGRLTLTPTAEDARDRLVSDWAAAEHPKGTVMIALTRADVDDLNALAQRHLEDRGVLDPDRPRVMVGERSFGIGERVMALRNDRRLGIVNGTAGTVTAVHPDGSLTLTPAAAPGGQPRASVAVTVPLSYLQEGRLTHGWAVTAHKAQGITTGQAFVLGTDRLYREAGYVALSRATTRTDWYQPSPSPPAWAPTVDPERGVTRILSRSAAQHLAIEPHLPAASGSPPRDEPRTGDPTTAADHRRQATDHRRQAAVLADPGEHLIDGLGPPPLAGVARREWADTALDVERYRQRAGITGRDLLGPAPDQDSAGQHREWTVTRLAVAQTRRTLGLDQDLDRGLGL
jgi:conjugative relaxase-like TrwC/TraI family protein